jgi:CRP-like cAMP-binding protein
LGHAFTSDIGSVAGVSRTLLLPAVGVLSHSVALGSADAIMVVSDTKRASNGAAPQNRLLTAIAALPSRASKWRRSLEPITLEHGEVLASSGETWSHVYFPESAVLSVIARMRDGAAAEVGTVGNEGMVDVSAFLADQCSVNETLVQIPGTGHRVPRPILQAAANASPALRNVLARYTQAYLTQVAQTAACNRLHTIERRCARWLLMTHDRVQGADHFPLTQEFLAIMLGVRRAGVTVAANALQDAGLIRYRRGSIRILDRAGLEAASCECYGVVRHHLDRLLP